METLPLELQTNILDNLDNWQLLFQVRNTSRYFRKLVDIHGQLAFERIGLRVSHAFSLALLWVRLDKLPLEVRCRYDKDTLKAINVPSAEWLQRAQQEIGTGRNSCSLPLGDWRRERRLYNNLRSLVMTSVRHGGFQERGEIQDVEIEQWDHFQQSFYRLGIFSTSSDLGYSCNQLWKQQNLRRCL